MRLRLQLRNRTTVRFRRSVAATLVFTLLASCIYFALQFGDSEVSKAGTQANETMATGSFIINMGVTPQTVANGLKPYGMVYDLIRNYGVPVKWVIEPTKARDGNDFAHNGVNYRGGPFIIPKEYISATVASRIAYWQTQGVVGAYTVSAISVPVAFTLTSVPVVMIDALSGNDNILISYYTNAGIPSNAYIVGTPAQLTGCYDVWSNPHGDPTWATHSFLYDFVTTHKSWIWAQCHSVSVMEYCQSSVAPIRQLNFLTSGGLQCYGNNKCGSNPESHAGNATAPFTYSFPADPIMQFMGNMHNATTSGSENWYVPLSTGQWNAATRRGVRTSDGSSPREGVVLVYGPAYGNASNGWVMYEAGHNLSSGGSSAADRVAAQRAYFNFIFLASAYKKVQVNGSVTSTLPSGGSGTASASATSGTPPYSYQWTSQLGGTFGNSTAASTSYTAPTVGSNTQDLVTLRVTDACGRISFYTQFIQITYNPLPVSLVSFDAKRVGSNVETNWVTASEVNNDYFTVERSSDGQDFQPVARIVGHGTTSEMNRYAWTDERAPVGPCYYRLRQTDFDGHFETFRTIPVESGRASKVQDISVYPNPVRDQFRLQVSADSDVETTLRVFAMTGACVLTKDVVLQRGENVISCEASDLQKGNYQLVLESDHVIGTARFSVIR